MQKRIKNCRQDDAVPIFYAHHVQHPQPEHARITQVLIYRVTVLRPTRHKIGHFGDVLPSQALGLVLKN